MPQTLKIGAFVAPTSIESVSGVPTRAYHDCKPLAPGPDSCRFLDSTNARSTPNVRDFQESCDRGDLLSQNGIETSEPCEGAPGGMFPDPSNRSCGNGAAASRLINRRWSMGSITDDGVATLL
jgi:hypothetical protein